MQANIINIQHYSIHDGSGVRTVVFFKGCPLHCLWCANPESQEMSPELLFDEKFCCSCGDCLNLSVNNEMLTVDGKITVNPQFQPRIISDKRFFSVCPAKALTVSGKSCSVTEVMTEVEKDRLFYRDGGGLTLSGGEPLLQVDFVRELLKTAKSQGINTAVETCLHVPQANLEQCLPWIDAALADVKHIDPIKYKRQTGGNLELAKSNFAWLNRQNKKVIARIPVIPGFNETPDERKAILSYISEFSNIREINLMPFHTLGAGKCRLLGKAWAYKDAKNMQAEELIPWVEDAEKLGLKATIGG